MDDSPDPARPFVSVIVPVRDDADRLEACLGRLRAQTWPRDRFEVVVVDNGSREPLTGRGGEGLDVVLCREERVGPYVARNRGIARARGEIIAFTDADCVPAEDWIEAGVRGLGSDPSLGLLAGRIDTVFADPANPTPLEIYERLSAFPQRGYVEEEGFGATANLFTRRSVVEEVGGFETGLLSGGDREWGRRVRRRGYSQRYADDVVVGHPARATVTKLRQKIRRVVEGVFTLSQWGGDPRVRFGRLLPAYAKPPLGHLRRIWTGAVDAPFGTKLRASFLLFYVRYLIVYELIRVWARSPRVPPRNERGRPPSPRRKRLWLTCRTFGGASETWIWRQATGLADFRVRVVTWERERESEYPFEPELVTEVPFHPAPETGSGRWITRLQNVPGGNFYGAAGAELRFLCDLLRRDRPDAILSHFGFNALRLLPVARRGRIPLVVHFHAVDITAMLGNQWYRRSLVRSLPKFAAIVVVAEYQRRWLLDHGVPEERIHVIPCGVPTDEFRPVDRREVDPCRFLTVGRFVEKKGPMHTVRAFAHCLDRLNGERARLTMVGSGPLLEPTRRLARELGVADRVRFLEEQPVSAVRREMAASSVLVQHSLTAPNGDREGWPVAIGEAMAAGLPIVATRHAGIETQVVEGENGRLVDEGDWRAMGDAMLELVRDAEARRRMGRAGRERAVERFDVRRMVGRLQEVLRAVTAESRGASPSGTGFAPTERNGHVSRR